MTMDRKVCWLFRINAVINWALAIRGILDPEGMASTFGGPVPNYPFVIRLWSAFIFMFGWPGGMGNCWSQHRGRDQPQFLGHESR